VQQLEGHGNSVNAVAFSPDGQLLASASRDNTVRLWNWATGEPVQLLKGHGSLVNAVAFSPDGQLLASASWDNTVRLWNPATGEQVQQLEGHGNSVNAVAFSPDGQLLASASRDNTVRLWNWATGEPVQRFEFTASINQIRFSSDSRCLETDRGIVCLYSSQSTVRSRTLHAVDSIFLNGDWITRDGQNLLWVPHDYRGRHFAFRDNLLVIGQHSGQVDFIALSPQSS
jgi:WD40 repeat protein